MEETVTLKGKLIHKTAGAYLIRIGEEEIWLPILQLLDEDIIGDDITFVITKRLAEQHSLEGEALC